MTKKTINESFSDSFWSGSSHNGLFATPSSLSLNKKKSSSPSLQEFLHPVDETPDFHDPYSNLSLFLSEKIKKEIEGNAPIQKWTLKLQEELIKKITPEFQKKFPQYRLGVTAVKKIWEKILFYTQQIQGKSEAVDQNGKLNINFFIKENLKQYFLQKTSSLLNPYHFASQIASKMSECIATLEGKKPKLDLLTQTIWSLQKHLLNSYPLQSFKTPYDKFDKVDTLVVKTILETTAKNPHIGMDDLEYKTKESLQALHDLPRLSSLEQTTCNVSALLAEKLYATSPFHILFFTEQKEAICHFLKKHTSLYKNNLAAPHLPGLVRRITALYSLASQLPKDTAEETFLEAVTATFTGAKERPPLPQSTYAFISAELCLLKGGENPLELSEVKTALFEAYQNTFSLPILNEKDKGLLEVVIWKILSESEEFLEKLPYRIGQKIEEEIAYILIDNPNKSFSSIVHETVQFFLKVKELTEHKNWKSSDKKIHLWCLQNDMLCRSIKINLDTPLASMIQKKWENLNWEVSHTSFVSEICQEFLQKFPGTTIYMAQLNSKVWTLYKYMWFTNFSMPKESSFDRFLKWHILFLKKQENNEEKLLKQLEEVCKKSLPLMPFDLKHSRSLLSYYKEENYA
jgi:hypothetical protein